MHQGNVIPQANKKVKFLSDRKKSLHGCITLQYIQYRVSTKHTYNKNCTHPLTTPQKFVISWALSRYFNSSSMKWRSQALSRRHES